MMRRKVLIKNYQGFRDLRLQTPIRILGERPLNGLTMVDPAEVKIPILPRRRSTTSLVQT